MEQQIDDPQPVSVTQSFEILFKFFQLRPDSKLISIFAITFHDNYMHIDV